MGETDGRSSISRKKMMDRIYENKNYGTGKTGKTCNSIIKSTNMQEKYCFICQSLGEKVE